jgi:hypothetical protein
MVATSAALMAHHAFSCWHGDFRLRRKYGEVGFLNHPKTLERPWTCGQCLCCACMHSAGPVAVPLTFYFSGLLFCRASWEWSEKWCKRHGQRWAGQDVG